MIVPFSGDLELLCLPGTARLLALVSLDFGDNPNPKTFERYDQPIYSAEFDYAVM